MNRKPTVAFTASPELPAALAVSSPAARECDYVIHNGALAKSRDNKTLVEVLSGIGDGSIEIAYASQTYNLNDRVEFEPTMTGIRALVEHYGKEDLRHNLSAEMVLNALRKRGPDGGVLLQLWEFMKIFGPGMGNGSDAVAHLNIIRIRRSS